MTRLPPWFRWLALAALGDWLIARTLTRTIIFVPKPPPVVAAYQALTLTGRLASTLTPLLGVMVLGWIAWRHGRSRHPWGLSGLLLGLLTLSVTFLTLPSLGWGAVAFHLFVLAYVGALGGRAWAVAKRVEDRIALTFPALAIGFGGFYQLVQALYAASHWPGPAQLAIALFNLGELCAVLTPWGCCGRPETAPSGETTS